MKVLLWHVHGSWTTSFVQGRHSYLLPVTPDRGADGLGRARTWNWPASVREVTPEQLRAEDVYVVVPQRTRDLELVHVHVAGAATRGCEGARISELGLMCEAGAVYFTDADRPPTVAPASKTSTSAPPLTSS